MARHDDLDALLAGIPQHGAALGAATAPVTLHYFGDLQCPYCSQFTLEALPSILERWVRGGHLRIEYRALEAATRDPEVFVAQQVAALGAGRQDKAWDFIETFAVDQGEENTGYVTEPFLEAVAGEIPGLDLSRWIADRRDPELVEEIAADAQAANRAGITGTPSFEIGRTGGAMTRLTRTGPGGFDEAIERLLKRSLDDSPGPEAGA